MSTKKTLTLADGDSLRSRFVFGLGWHLNSLDLLACGECRR